MSAKVSVIIKKPGRLPYKTAISPRLENLQATVGGYIETVTLGSDWTIICNEEGRLMGMPYNCNVCGVDFVGPIVFIGVDGEEFADLPIEFTDFKKAFKNLWEDN